MDDQTEVPDERDHEVLEHELAPDTAPPTRAWAMTAFGWPINPAPPITFMT
ncbi:hypothetical protein [Streptomyces sp. NPDC053079]|uniref:hypothetical protein n=1 Tax=Streptomyces sp. NPDC053079 TaxID=3365697 RepID=UPI0037CDAA5D